MSAPNWWSVCGPWLSNFLLLIFLGFLWFWLTEPSFDYEIDPATDVVYLKQGSKQIVALRFDIGTSVPPQAHREQGASE